MIIVYIDYAPQARFFLLRFSHSKMMISIAKSIENQNPKVSPAALISECNTRGNFNKLKGEVLIKDSSDVDNLRLHDQDTCFLGGSLDRSVFRPKFNVDQESNLL